MCFQTYESALMAPDWTSHVFSGPGLPGALEPVMASWDIQVSQSVNSLIVRGQHILDAKGQKALPSVQNDRTK